MAIANSPYDGTRYGRERCGPATMPRHRHDFAYMCLILRGGFQEAGDAGRFRVGPGDILVHHEYEAHLDLFGSAGVELLNLPLPRPAPTAGRFRIDDPDSIVGIAEHDPFAAAEAAMACWTLAPGEADWPDLLASDLAGAGPLVLGRWAARHGLAPATVSRGFRQAYGTTPVRFRAEQRARRAWAMVRSSNRPLVHLALDAGFADQAHMSRSIRALTGAPPLRWRSTLSNGEVNSVQDRSAPRS